MTSSTRPPKPKPSNPIEDAIAAWLPDLSEAVTGSEELVHYVDTIVARAPKRWVVYPPMVLLPTGNTENKWWSIAEDSNPVLTEERDRLWRLILNQIGKREGKGWLTHLAINSGIPLLNSSDHHAQDQDVACGGENILRTPSGLIMLYGDFGPSLLPSLTPTSDDFEKAFWVSTRQNGITQIWAPRYTMFSRGNVKEKARLLAFPSSPSSGTAIDLYAGIGYFVFSYAKLGLKVIGWELNPWSVEGLRRGALANGWTIKVIQNGEIFEHGAENITVLAEDNQLAAKRLQRLEPGFLASIKHINCGLLPTSDLTWKMSSELLTSCGWLHLHENVGVEDVQTRRGVIESTFQAWLMEQHPTRIAKVEHVELVKTFAPGVWHCVFDVFITTSHTPDKAA